jgi:hypothetical protein
MTLIASINGPETIWLLADRRISWEGRPPRDDAQKVMLLRAVDGAAILGYAGLGVTAYGTEPSAWMQAVLHRRALPLEESLSILAEAMERELPQHLSELPAAASAHIVMVPAFYGTWQGSTARLYTIDSVQCPKHRQHFVVRRHDLANTGVPMPVAVAGSGGRILRDLLKDPKLRSPLRRMVKASARGRISAHTVADYLARLNYEAHKADPLGSVGPRCIIVWRHRLGGRRFGGGFLYYKGATREHETVQRSLIPPLVDPGFAGFYRIMKRHIAHESGKSADQSLESEINTEMGLPGVFPEEKLR